MPTTAAATNSLSPPVNAKIKEIRRIAAFGDSDERHWDVSAPEDNEEREKKKTFSRKSVDRQTEICNACAWETVLFKQ